MLARLLQRVVTGSLLLLIASLCLASPSQSSLSETPASGTRDGSTEPELRLAVAALDLDRYGPALTGAATAVVSTPEYQAFGRREKKTALSIERVLNLPEIIAVQEVQDEATLSRLASAASKAGVTYRAYMEPQSEAGASHLGFLVDTAKVQVTRIQMLPSSGAEQPTGDNTSEPLWRDPPLMLEALPRSADGGALPWIFINVHLASVDDLGGDGAPAHARRLRRRQMDAIATLVHRLQQRRRQTVVLGNFGTEPDAEASDAAAQILAQAGESGFRLTDRAQTLSVRERYNFVDHAGPAARERIFTPTSVAVQVVQPHLNTEATDDEKLSETTPAGAGRYDGQLAILSIPVRRLTAEAERRFTGDFGEQAVGSGSVPQTFRITASATNLVPVTFQSPRPTGPNPADFAITENTCTRLGPGEHCALTIVFTPSALGARSAALTVINDSLNQPAISLLLTGTGTTALVLDSSQLAFGDQEVSSTSPARLVMVKNVSAAPLSLASLGISAPDWSLTSDCGDSVPSHATCLLRVTFTPTSAGPHSGELRATDSALLTPLRLGGNGVDFSFGDPSGSGTTVAGKPASATAVLLSLSGFKGTVALSCATSAPASTCQPAAAEIVLTDRAVVPVTITTKSRYLVVGYEGATPGLAAAATLIFTTLFVPAQPHTVSSPDGVRSFFDCACRGYAGLWKQAAATASGLHPAGNLSVPDHSDRWRSNA